MTRACTVSYTHPEVIEEAEKRLSDLPDEEYVAVIGSMLSSMDKKLGTEVIVSEKDKTRLADVISKNGFTLSDLYLIHI